MGFGTILKAALPFAGPIGGIASGVMDMLTQKQSNQANAANVQKQLDFQERMSSTSYQRGVADLEKAGLNPALAYTQAGASSPTGGAATAEPLSQNTPSKFATALQTYNEFANGAAQRDLMREQATAAGQNARYQQIQGSLLEPELLASQTGDYRREYFRKRLAEQFRGTAEATNYPERFKAEMGNIGATTAAAQASAEEARSRTTLNEQQFQTAWFRKHVAPYLNNTNAATAAAGKGLNLIRKF